jgi:hypothetical protein
MIGHDTEHTTETVVVTGRVEETVDRGGGIQPYRHRHVTLDLGSLVEPHDDWLLNEVWRTEERPGEVILELDGPAVGPRPPLRLRYVPAMARRRDERPAFFCKHCGWSEDPANPWQVKASDQAFHTPCPAPPGDPGMAETPGLLEQSY